VFPAPHLAVMKSDASWAAKALALTFVAAHWLSPLMLGKGRVWVIKLDA
jgi:hypothetical protein